MLDLNALYHLPQLDGIFAEIAAETEGLVVVAGLEPRGPVARATAHQSLSGGRGFIFAMLARQTLAAQPHTRAALISEHKDPNLRLPARVRPRVKLVPQAPDETYRQAFERAVRAGYPLLLAEKLTRDATIPALDAARTGRRVLTQLDAPLCGKWVVRYLRDLCGEPVALDGLRWVIAVRRLPALCETCKQPDGDYFRAPGCATCEHTGRRGEIAVFDIWRADPPHAPDSHHSVLSFDEYAEQLARAGYLPQGAARDLDADQLYATFQILNASEDAGVETTQILRAQVGELEVARRTLEQQYRTSITLQEVGYKLLDLATVDALAAYICRRARDLCGADRAVVYLARPDGSAEITALNGWDPAFLGTRVSQAELFSSAPSETLHGYPPGIPSRPADLEGAHLRAGLCVPLTAQGEQVGAMVFHSTVRRSFDARDTALLHALANAGAAAIQRAGLIDQLRVKIEELEAAQAEIAKQERLERELELARQVQQSMLPRVFPRVPGAAFYARSEPARQVGGDFYDVFTLDPARIGLVIADVSDKGLPAALFMALTRSLVRAEASRAASPLTVLRRVHHLLLELAGASQFVTLWYGVLDLAARSLTYVRAGHDYPLLVRQGETRLLDAAGTILGILQENELHLTEATVELEKGDRLFLYTDGLTDAIDEAEELFGRDRLKAAALAGAHLPVQELGDAVFSAVTAHQGAAERFDDMTLLIVELKLE